MNHLLETSVGGIDSAANDTEAMALHLLAEQVVLGEGDLLVKSAQFAKFLLSNSMNMPVAKGRCQRDRY